jgi:hypothetical protein
MAFKRIVANSEEDLKTIMNDIMNWFKETKDYKVDFSKEKRKFLDDNKNIVEKDIDVIKVVDGANGKETSIKFVPMKEKGEMKVEIGGEGEAAIAGKISNQMKSKGKLKSYSKDKKVKLGEEDTKKPEITDDELMKKIKSSLSFQVSGGKKGKPGLKESLDKRIATVFFKYKGKSFPMDYKTGSMFERFINDLTKSGAFNSEDEVSDFMASEEFDSYANKFNVEIDWAEYDPTPLELAPKEPTNPQDSIPGRAPKDFVSADMPHRVSDLMEKLNKTGKLTKSELKEILLHEYKNKL